MREAADVVERKTALTHHIRGALASLLISHTTPDIQVCLQCEEPMTKHNQKSPVARLLQAVGE